MALAPGTKLGPYEILAPLGAGGMGEVWRARDTRLGRDVAVKVLPDHLAGEPNALRRFESEARAVAALSHPNILALHDVGEATGVHYAVTELLEGETLRALVARGPLSVKRALEISRLVADALAAAHEKGVVHRDVKPENVFLTRDGHVKLLDFGLARYESSFRDDADCHTPTVSVRTDAGAVVGTVAYMSPEQARGLPVDRRTDQFSLGVTLYEMLAGKRPFKGESTAETLAAILREQPEPLGTLAPATPAPVRWLVDRCLAKDPADRYDSTRDLAREVTACATRLSAGISAEASGLAEARGAKGRRLLRPMTLAVALAGSILATAGVTKALARRSARSSSPVVRFELRLPEGHFLSGYRRPLALSPDGRLVVFSAATWKRPFVEENAPQLFVRPLDGFEARPIPGTEGGVQPVFSPDGRHVAFSVETEEGDLLKRVPVTGGPVTQICRCESTHGVSWSSRGSILLGALDGPLRRVHDTGGVPEQATTLDAGEGEVSHRLPHFLPDGRTFLYTSLRWAVAGISWKTARVFGQSPGEKERRLLVEWGSDGRWSPTGHLLFGRAGKLFAAPFDARALRLGGSPSQVLEGVSHSIWTNYSGTETGAVMADVAGESLLAWVPGSVAPEQRRGLVWVAPDGTETPVDVPRGPYLGCSVSPDGERLLLPYVYPGRQVEVLELSRGARRNVTFDENPTWAVWGPGPERITYASDHEGPVRIYSRRIDGGPGEIDTLWDGGGQREAVPGAWSRDGKTFAFLVSDQASGYDLWVREEGKAPRPIVATRFREAQPDISPDGRWILYTSTESGRMEVLVRPLAGEGPTRQVSAGGGVAPLWSPDGSTIFYWSWSPERIGLRHKLLRVRARVAGGHLTLGRPELHLEARYKHFRPGRSWSLGPGDRVLIVLPSDEAESREWAEKVFSDRIRFDVGGLPALLEEALKGR